jgi:malonyl-CoA O-methyltransferase
VEAGGMGACMRSIYSRAFLFAWTSAVALSAPPTLDPVALARWHQIAPASSPWLHEEVARRMLERLQWIKLRPHRWTHWEPVRGGQAAHAALREHCGTEVSVVERQPVCLQAARRLWQPAWWRPGRWSGAGFSEPEAGSQDMVWANMALHQEAAPQELLARWHRLLKVDGFVMFSCLGPDSAVELHRLYQELGWPPAGQALTDMHDWGDMLVQIGFAEPVMDMERLTLTFESAERLLAELAELGRNVHPARFASLRGRRWKQRLLSAIEAQVPRQPDGRLSLTFELIYGHAIKPQPRVKVDGVSSVSVEDMRRMLHAGRPGQAPRGPT